MSKNKYTEEDFTILIDSEKIAYYVYNYFNSKNKDLEKVDIIVDTFCDLFKTKEQELATYYRAKLVLEKDYGIDIYSYPFKNESLKAEIKQYEFDMQDKINNGIQEVKI